jgi:MerR family transcriptional regulator, thiopeptide resistance regulator
MSYTVGEVATLASITVRTLHHYDEIGLLTPSGRTDGGYRQYTDADLDRLQQVLFYRELGFALDDIVRVLDDPCGDPASRLRDQRRLLLERVERLQRMVAGVEKALEAHTMGISLTPEERLELFGDFDPSEYAAEAEERWGDTDAWKESRRRAATYTKEDWKRILAEGERITHALAEALREGAPADGERAMDLAERHRRHITDAFYDCGHDIHRGLGQLYVEDERFAAHYDRVEPGLAAYLDTAIRANADRHT